VPERISRETLRRFVLGRQGLWPGRRWRGAAGTLEALRVCGRVQVDPLNVVGRNHDLVFASRVDGYRPEYLEKLLYERRGAFEHGGGLFIFPRERLALNRSEFGLWGLPDRWETWGRAHSRAVGKVRSAIQKHGPLSARYWIDGEATDDYRSRRIEGVALHYLWRRMEIMVHHREGALKFYDLSERLFGPWPEPLSPEATRDASAVDLAGWLGLSGRLYLSYLRGPAGVRRRDPHELRALRRRLVDAGRLAEVSLDGEREPGVLVAEALPELDRVANGEVPNAWRPISNESEAVFLGPLDVVSAHGRAKSLFQFEYTWEVYKPEHLRAWGYYVVPVLVGDRLVGRIEPVRDEPHGALFLRRAWWEPGIDPTQLAEPLARGLIRTAEALGLERVRLGRVGPAAMRDALARQLHRSEGAAGRPGSSRRTRRSGAPAKPRRRRSSSK
jgi:uncharacterized protein